jgi:hypothetical protein
MLTETDILVSEIQIKTKQGEVSLILLKQIFQKLDFHGATQCGMSCPICKSQGKVVLAG